MGIASLITNLLLDFALNTSNNQALGVVNYLSGGFLWWIALGGWTICSTLAAPWMISRQIVAGQPGIAALFGEAGGHSIGGARYLIRLGIRSAVRNEGAGAVQSGGASELVDPVEEPAPITTLVRPRRYSRRPA